MSLSYVLGGGVSSDPEVATHLCERYPAMRKAYEEISGWTGRHVDDILGTSDNPALPTVQQAALQIGSHDILAELGVRPDVIGGLSLGGLVSASLAGALPRDELFGYLMAFEDVPGPPADAPVQGLAFAMIPEGMPAELYYGPDREEVYLAGDFGISADGSVHVLMLSGMRAALEAVAAEVPQNTLILLPSETAAHSPYRESAADHVKDRLDAMPFTKPELPLCSCLERGTLATADDVREEFRRNLTAPVSLVSVCAEMKQTYNTRLGMVLGSTLAEGFLNFTFPVAHLTSEEHVVKATGKIFELGIELRAAR